MLKINNYYYFAAHLRGLAGLYVWIDGSRASKSTNVWQYSDGSPMTFTNWHVENQVSMDKSNLVTKMCIIYDKYIALDNIIITKVIN